MKEFINQVLSHRDNFVKVELKYRDISQIKPSVLKALKLDSIFKLNDMYEGVSFYNNFSRKVTGVLALGVFFDINYIDWNKVNPLNYNPLIKLGNKNIEVITFETGTFPTIPIKNKTPKIIILKRDEKNVWICGLATTKTLNKYQNSNLLQDSLTKNITSFNGFNYLINFNSEAELIDLI